MHDIIWRKFWYWVVIDEVNSYVYPSWKKRRRFLCSCKCWSKKEVNINNLISWDSKSCWCYQKENPSWVKHGMHWTDIYKVFQWIKARCNINSATWYKNYWWRGIKCKWKTFEDFYRDMWHGYRRWLQIDRIDVNWNYCKENCEWVTRSKQMRNTRNNRIITYMWKTMCMKDWADYLWIKQSTLSARINTYKWDIERAITEDIKIPYY